MVTYAMPEIPAIRRLPSEVPSFTTGKLGIFLTIVCIFLNLYNMYTDYALGVYYLYHGDTWWGAVTLSLALGSSLLISVYTFILHRKSGGRFLMQIDVSKPMVYTLCLLLHGQIARCLMWLKLLRNKVPLIGVKSALWVFRDLTGYAEVFVQSIPQFCLQMYVVIIYKGKFDTKLQWFCITASLLSASWGLLSQFVGFKWKLFAFQLNAFWICARAIAISTLATVDKIGACLLLPLHFFVMLPLWFWQNSYKPFRKKQNGSRLELMVTDAFYSITYATCNTFTPIACKYPFLLALLLAGENITCYLFAYHYGEIIRTEEHINRYHDYYSNLNKTVKCLTNSISANKECELTFYEWRQGNKFLIFGCIITALALIQIFIITLLKKLNKVDKDALVSRLGTCNCRRSTSANERISSTTSAVTNEEQGSDTTSSSTSPTLKQTFTIRIKTLYKDSSWKNTSSGRENRLYKQ